MNGTANIEHEVMAGWYVKVQDAHATRAARGVVFLVTDIEWTNGQRVARLSPTTAGRRNRTALTWTLERVEIPAGPSFDDIEPGQVWHVVPRCLTGKVINKFRSVSDSPGRPAGTEYVELIDALGMSFFNYPHHLAPVECPSCGVQLKRNGAVDALPGEPAEHYSDCAR